MSNLKDKLAAAPLTTKAQLDDMPADVRRRVVAYCKALGQPYQQVRSRPGVIYITHKTESGRSGRFFSWFIDEEL